MYLLKVETAGEGKHGSQRGQITLTSNVHHQRGLSAAANVAMLQLLMMIECVKFQIEFKQASDMQQHSESAPSHHALALWGAPLLYSGCPIVIFFSVPPPIASAVSRRAKCKLLFVLFESTVSVIWSMYRCQRSACRFEPE